MSEVVEKGTVLAGLAAAVAAAAAGVRLARWGGSEGSDGLGRCHVDGLCFGLNGVRVRGPLQWASGSGSSLFWGQAKLTA